MTAAIDNDGVCQNYDKWAVRIVYKVAPNLDTPHLSEQTPLQLISVISAPYWLQLTTLFWLISNRRSTPVCVAHSIYSVHTDCGIATFLRLYLIRMLYKPYSANFPVYRILSHLASVYYKHCELAIKYLPLFYQKVPQQICTSKPSHYGIAFWPLKFIMELHSDHWNISLECIPATEIHHCNAFWPLKCIMGLHSDHWNGLWDCILTTEMHYGIAFWPLKCTMGMHSNQWNAL